MTSELTNRLFRVDEIDLNSLLYNGVEISNYRISSEIESESYSDIVGDYRVEITPSMFDENGVCEFKRSALLPDIKGYQFVSKDTYVTADLEADIDYYVAPNGSDTNHGRSRDYPKRSINTIPTGSKIMLLNGSYSATTLMKRDTNGVTETERYCTYTLIGETKNGVTVNCTQYFYDSYYNGSLETTYRDMYRLNLYNFTIRFTASTGYISYPYYYNTGVYRYIYSYNMRYIATSSISMFTRQTSRWRSYEYNSTYVNTSRVSYGYWYNYTDSQYDYSPISTNYTQPLFTINGNSENDNYYDIKDNKLTINTTNTDFKKITIDLWV